MQKRRFFLMSLGAAGALAVGWGVMPARQRLSDKAFGDALPKVDGQVALNAWLKLGTDGVVTLAMPKSEMGQGIFTALSMIIAEELDISLSAVHLEPSPIAAIYGNVLGLSEGIPFRPDDESTLARTARWTMQKVMRELGIMMTGGSSSVKDLWLPLREAAAMTRASLINTLAKEWGVDPLNIQITQGVFSNGKRQLSLGDLIQQLGKKIEPATSYRLKPISDFKLMGKPTPRTDIDGKINGHAAFGMDASALDGKKPDFYAAVLMSPARGGGVAKVDSKTALVLLPNLNGHGGSGGIAVVAKSYWQAKKTLDDIKVEWGAAETSGWSNETITQALRTALDKESGFTYYSKGDMTPQPMSLSATYSAPYLAHATMEPMNATINLSGTGSDRKATIWVGTQVPDLARAAAAKALGLARENVIMKVPFLGGGFGRRLEVDIVAQAASIAASTFGANKEGTLQVIWSREADMQHDFYRPAAMAKFEARLDKNGNVITWVNKAASQHIVPTYFPRNVGLPLIGPDKTSMEGAFDQPYEFTNAHVSHVAVDLPIPVGFWRSVGHSHQAFFKESFLDECAHAAKADPLAYRRALLNNHPRHLAVLDLLAKKAGWTGLLSPAKDGLRIAQGLALHESFGSIVAIVAEVSVNNDQEIRIHRITAAVDCGFCINPNGVAQQVESSIAFGLSAALWGKIDFKDGKVQQSNFHDYRVLRMSEMPIVETHIVASTRAPEGMGEPALPPVAPAVANAVFTLTGQRLRDLPLKLA